MANIFKQRITRYVDENGRRVKKDTPGAKCVREKSKKWYGEYKDERGHIKRVALSTDKASAQAKLNDLVRKVERKQAGLFDPYEEHEKRSIADHLADYESFLAAKGNSKKHVSQSIGRIRRLTTGCGFKRLSEIDATKVAAWLATQRETKPRFSAQTSNFYLDAFKYFCNWLTKYERLLKNPVSSLDRVSVDSDRRHDRRSISDDEFRRLVDAAESGRAIEGLPGPDRAMLYILAAWTGFRRRELASLTLRSFDLGSDTPVVRVQAAYAKNKRADEIPLHPDVVQKLVAWLDEKGVTGADERLFELVTPSGHFRKTSKMMKKDLQTAKEEWTQEAKGDAAEMARREKSDFLSYQDENGLFADFHANRHTFISNLSRAGVPLTVAQKLARHSDPRLTANRYTHLDLGEKAKAISSLSKPAEPAGTGETGENAVPDKSLVAGMVAGVPAVSSPELSQRDTDRAIEHHSADKHKPRQELGFGAKCLELSATDKAPPAGFEPATFGLGTRIKSCPTVVTGISYEKFISRYQHPGSAMLARTVSC